MSCEKAQLDGKDDTTDAVIGFNVILENTILFPEGGGQPCDRGLLNGRPVLNVVRRGAEAVHFVQSDEEFRVDEPAHQQVDWTRRFDHMQQHSGQHLVTAIFEQDYGFNTTAWYLGAETSFIELDTKTVTADQLRQAEQKCNQIIANGRRVTVISTDNEHDLSAEV